MQSWRVHFILPLARRWHRMMWGAVAITAAHGVHAAADPVAPAGGSKAGVSTAITPIDSYEQWRSALDTGKGVAPPTFTVLPGFEIETLRTARPDEGSWVGMAFDAKGRLIVAREKRGLLRFTLSNGPLQAEVIDDTLEEVRGIV